MSWRSRVRTSLVYVVSIVAGFALAWLIVAFVVFPSGVVPRDVKVPNVTGLMFDEATQRLAQAGFKSEQGEARFTASACEGMRGYFWVNPQQRGRAKRSTRGED